MFENRSLYEEVSKKQPKYTQKQVEKDVIDELTTCQRNNFHGQRRSVNKSKTRERERNRLRRAQTSRGLRASKNGAKNPERQIKNEENYNQENQLRCWRTVFKMKQDKVMKTRHQRFKQKRRRTKRCCYDEVRAAAEARGGNVNIQNDKSKTEKPTIRKTS